MSSKLGPVAAIAFLMGAVGCGAPKVPPPASLLFMRSASYVGTLTTPRGEKRQIWKLDRPFKEVLHDGSGELSASKGWRTKSVLDSQMTFYTNQPRRAVILTDGATDSDSNLIAGTTGVATTVVTDGF